MVKMWKRAVAMGLLAVCLALSIGACTVNKTEIQTGAEEFRDSETEKIGAVGNGEETESDAEIKDSEESKNAVEEETGGEAESGEGTDRLSNAETKDIAGGKVEAGEAAKAKNDAISVSTELAMAGKNPKSKKATNNVKTDADKGKKTKPSTLATPSNSGALQVIGTQLCDKDGKPVQLRGISTHGLAWFPDYVNDALFKQFRNEWNVNVMRLAMYTGENAGYCTGGDKAALKKLVKKGVKYATDNDMYVIIDWHVLNDQDPNVYKEDAKAFFKEMSKAYADADNVIYEICNEPNGGTTWSDIKAYANAIIPVIRKNDSDAVIIVGTPNWSQYVDQAAEDPISGYDNIMYALHFYAATHKEWLRDTMTNAIDQGLPVFVSEYGICDASGNGGIDETEAENWIKAMDKYGVSYVMWNLSNKNETSSIISASCTKTSDLETSDLSDSGKWLYHMLMSGKNGAGDSGKTKKVAVAEKSGKESKKNSSDRKDKKQDNNAKNSKTGSGSSQSKETAEKASDWVVSVTGSKGTKATVTVSNQWETEGSTYCQYTLDVDNISSKKLEKWNVKIKFNEDITLENGWNGQMTVSGKTLTIEPVDYNSTIEAGASVTDIGFIVHD